jgi:hypothetical protein
VLCASQKNENPAVITALIEGGANVNAKGNVGRTPLHLAASYDKNPYHPRRHNLAILVIAALIKAGADVDEKGKYKGMTALHIAVTKGNIEIVSLLLQAGAKFDIENDREQTALNLAPPQIRAWILDSDCWYCVSNSWNSWNAIIDNDTLEITDIDLLTEFNQAFVIFVPPPPVAVKDKECDFRIYNSETDKSRKVKFREPFLPKLSNADPILFPWLISCANEAGEDMNTSIPFSVGAYSFEVPAWVIIIETETHYVSGSQGGREAQYTPAPIRKANLDAIKLLAHFGMDLGSRTDVCNNKKGKRTIRECVKGIIKYGVLGGAASGEPRKDAQAAYLELLDALGAP